MLEILSVVIRHFINNSAHHSQHARGHGRGLLGYKKAHPRSCPYRGTGIPSLHKGPNQAVYDEDVELTIGKANLLRDGKDIAIIANGDTVNIAVSEVCAGMGKGIVKRIGVQDWFGQSGPYDKLLEINGITKEDIVKTAEELLK